jgi:large conductance mechanosensitive channel
MSGFKKFLLRGNVVDLAIAVIIGIAFGMVISAFTKDIITPIIAAIGGKPNFADLHFTINNSVFLYGDFLNAVISFIILAAIVYFFVVVPVGAMLDRYKPTSVEPAPTEECPHCKSMIPRGASVCAFCTRDIAQPPTYNPYSGS